MYDLLFHFFHFDCSKPYEMIKNLKIKQIGIYKTIIFKALT